MSRTVAILQDRGEFSLIRNIHYELIVESIKQEKCVDMPCIAALTSRPIAGSDLQSTAQKVGPLSRQSCPAFKGFHFQ